MKTTVVIDEELLREAWACFDRYICIEFSRYGIVKKPSITN